MGYITLNNGKMLRSTKRFGRCGLCQGNHEGHGECEVTHEIQSVAITRTEDKRKSRKEIIDQLNDQVEEYEGNG